MISQVVVYDPTANDPLSKVRGVGRYIQILRENFSAWTFTNELTSQPANQPATFINPFFNFLQSPLSIKRIANKQIAVIHDLIPLKYPEHFPVGIKGKFNIFLNTLVLRNYDIVVTDSEASKKDIMKILGIDERKIIVIYPCLPKIFSHPEFSSGSDSGQARMTTQIPKSIRQAQAFGSEAAQARRDPESIEGHVRNDNETMKQSNNLTIPSQYCLYVGDATWNKNLVNLARAIKEINITCVFVSKVFSNQSSVISNKTDNRKLTTENYTHPWQKELRGFLMEVKDDKRFVFPGFIPDEELIELYKNARCNILISRDEGFGFSYLEAASQSCPSVLSDIPTLKEISDSKGTLFAPPEKISDIANSIGEFYFNRDKRNTFGIEAERQSRSYSYSTFTQAWSKILA